MLNTKTMALAAIAYLGLAMGTASADGGSKCSALPSHGELSAAQALA